MCRRERRVSGCVTIGGFVDSLDQIASVLEFNGEKERGGDVDAAHFDATGVAATGSNLIGPESETGRVRLSIKKVVIGRDSNTCCNALTSQFRSCAQTRAMKGCFGA